MHKLALVAIIGLTASAVCIGAAAAIGGRNFGDDIDFSLFNDRPHCETAAGATATSRDLDWDGSDQIRGADTSHAAARDRVADTEHLGEGSAEHEGSVPVSWREARPYPKIILQ